MRFKKHAEAQHESLSKLFIENPEAFHSVTQTMIDRMISNSSIPDKLKELQSSMKNLFKTKEELQFESSMEQLKDKFRRE